MRSGRRPRRASTPAGRSSRPARATCSSTPATASGVFDPSYGYDFNPGPDSAGRDIDVDGIPTELDPDSDAGGCQDGEEDRNADGHRNGKETSNFDASDDACLDLSGTISYT